MTQGAGLAAIGAVKRRLKQMGFEMLSELNEGLG